jgi:hypothetical protein
VLGALILAMPLLSGCTMGTPPSPSPTPVPIATWIAQGIPDDTVIDYGWGYVSSQSAGGYVTIIADGAVTSESWLTIPQDVERRQGQISQDELEWILLKLERINFFSLASDGKCVYYLAHPPAPSEHRWGTTSMDSSWMYVSVTLHGVSKSISTSRQGGPPQKCLFDDTAFYSLDEFLAMIREIGRQIPKVTPSAASPTPTPSH